MVKRKSKKRNISKQKRNTANGNTLLATNVTSATNQSQSQCTTHTKQDIPTQVKNAANSNTSPASSQTDATNQSEIHHTTHASIANVASKATDVPKPAVACMTQGEKNTKLFAAASHEKPFDINRSWTFKEKIGVWYQKENDYVKLLENLERYAIGNCVYS